MEPQEDIISQNMARLSDEELLRVLTTEAADYTPEALSAAQCEAEKRGGFVLLRDQGDESRHAREERARERTREQIEIRRKYPLWQHVITIAERWYKAYGVLAIMWLVFRTGSLGVNALFGLLVLTLLFVVQATIWAAVTYRKAVRERRLLVCEHCGKTLIVNIRSLSENTAPASAGQLPCPSCGQPTGAKLEELMRQAVLESDSEK